MNRDQTLQRIASLQADIKELERQIMDEATSSVIAEQKARAIHEKQLMIDELKNTL
jgi:hypothetical protein